MTIEEGQHLAALSTVLVGRENPSDRFGNDDGQINLYEQM